MYLTLLKALKEKLHTDAQQQHRVPGLSTSPWLVPKDCLVLRKFCFQCITSWFQTLSEMHESINADDNWSGLPGKTTRLHHAQTTYPNAQICPWTFIKANHFDWTRHPFHLLPRSSAELPHTFSQCKLPKHQTQLTFQWRFRSPAPPAQGCWWFRPAPGIEAWRRSSGMRLGIRSGLCDQDEKQHHNRGNLTVSHGGVRVSLLSWEKLHPAAELWTWGEAALLLASTQGYDPIQSWAIEPCSGTQGNGGLLPPLLSHYLPVRDGETEGRGKAVH